ncbi:C39 family peptidase [Brevibacillus centrosporus]|uniref:Peptidase_C39 like family protein n=1 Tax=Brevibacillus centrosporus TaxID=54910 RepID=A0A1I4E232_9BACL|nr:C39 family peptidase [Brevibacillus centrosporus]SFK99884.1 Peptidase_C39 like family protein [Brevibacillus centrosporus]
MGSFPNGNKVYREISDFALGVFEGVRGSRASLTLDANNLISANDTTSRYHGGVYYYGRYSSSCLYVNFKEAIISWEANTPPGTWIAVDARVQVKGNWSKWYNMGTWLEHNLPFSRHSTNNQGDSIGNVNTDTLIIVDIATAIEVQVSLFTLDPAVSPSVRSVGITFSQELDKAGLVPRIGLVSNLSVPKRSQMLFHSEGGKRWCSPSCISMVMAYWADVMGKNSIDNPIPRIVQGVWDFAYGGSGNWAFNTAYAASFGLHAKVVRLSSLVELEYWTAAGVPVIVSIAFRRGQLKNAPLLFSSGHLVVIRGFDKNGDVLTNDPAAPSDDTVSITYDRIQFENAWLNKSNGTVYLIYPTGWKIPKSNGKW